MKLEKHERGEGRGGRLEMEYMCHKKTKEVMRKTWWRQEGEKSKGCVKPSQ